MANRALWAVLAVLAGCAAAAPSPWQWESVNLRPMLPPLTPITLKTTHPSGRESFHVLAGPGDVRTAILAVCPHSSNPPECMQRIEATWHSYVLSLGTIPVTAVRVNGGPQWLYRAYEGPDMTARLMRAYGRSINETFVPEDWSIQQAAQAVANDMVARLLLPFGERVPYFVRASPLSSCPPVSLVFVAATVCVWWWWGGQWSLRFPSRRQRRTSRSRTWTSSATS